MPLVIPHVPVALHALMSLSVCRYQLLRGYPERRSLWHGLLLCICIGLFVHGAFCVSFPCCLHALLRAPG